MLTGRLLADFSSFSTAVKKADVELKSMETSAGKVGSSLNRMVDNFSGRKLVQDATLAAEAVERIGGTSKLTQNELGRLQAQATEASDKLKAMGQEVPPGIQKIADAAKNIAPPITMADRAAGLLKSTFGQFTAASIVSNLIGKAAGEIGRFIDQGSRLPGLQASFNSLTRAIGQDGPAMLNNMSTATKGLVSNYDLITSANKAMLLGLPVTSQSMGELSKAATTLGRAMGMDATKSLDDLITALGRSSPMILDNLGLTVKVGEANEAYAAKLGKTTAQLSDAEKKMAFYEAAMESARRKTQELGEQTKTLGEIAQSAWTSIGNVVSQVAGDMNVAIGRILSSKDEFLQFLKDVAATGTAGGALAAAAVRGSAGQKRNKPLPFEDPSALARPSQAYLDDLKAAEEAYKKSKAAAQAAADALRDYARELSGGKLQDSVTQLARAVGLLSAEQRKQPDVIARIVSASEALRAQGAKLTPELRALANAHIDIAKALPPVVSGWQGVIGTQHDVADSARQLGIVTAGVATPILALLPISEQSFGVMKTKVTVVKTEAEKLRESLSALSGSLANLAQVAGGSFGQVSSGLATIVGSINTARTAMDAFKTGLAAAKAGEAIAGIAGMASGIGGIVTAAIEAAKAIKAIWAAFDRNKGRDLVKDFAESFGGFDALHKELLMLGEAGEALWIKLTQGVGRNNPAQAEKVIAEVEAALAKQKAAQEAATISTEEGARATIETATEAQKELDKLGARLLKNAEEWDRWSDAVMEYIKQVADGIRMLPPLPPYGGSGTGTVTQSGTIIRGGRPGGGSTPTVGGGGAGSPTLVQQRIELNGRELWAGMLEVGAQEDILGG